MEETRRNLIVGLFVLIGLAGLGTLIILFGRGPTWLTQGGTYPMTVRFDHGEGIRTGSLVTLNGITIGRVQSVEVADLDRPGEGVYVRVTIEEPYKLPLGTTAETTEPVLGQGRPPIRMVPPSKEELALLPEGADRWLAAGSEITGINRGAIETFFPPDVVDQFTLTARQIGDAADALTPVLAEVEKILEERTPGEVDAGTIQGNLSSALARLDHSLAHFNEVLGDPEVRSQLRDSISNLHEMTERGTAVMEDVELAAKDSRGLIEDTRTFVGNANDTLARVDTRVTELSRATLDSLERADTLLDNLNAVGEQVRKGEGTVGRFIMDDELYESLLFTIQRLARATEEFEALLKQWREDKVRIGM